MTTCLLLATDQDDLVMLAAAQRSGVLDPMAHRVLLLDAGKRSGALRRSAETLAPAAVVTSTEDLLGSPEGLAAAGVEGDLVELVVGTRSLETGRTLARRLAPVTDLTVSLLVGGAAAYGPTPTGLRGRLARATTRVLHLDLVPGLAPLVLGERAVPSRPIPPQAHRAAVATLPPAEPLPDPTALVLGRRAAWGGAFDVDQQAALLAAMVSRCAEAGQARVAVLLDQDTRPRVRHQLEKVAKAVRADLRLVEDPLPVERWFATGGTGLVVGCADPALLVAAAYGRRVAQLDTEVVLRRVEPFADEVRPGATLVAATVPDLRSWAAAPEGEPPTPVDLPGLVTAVAYAMEPYVLADRRAEVVAFLAAGGDPGRRFVRRRRLTALRLPGGKRRVRRTLP